MKLLKKIKLDNGQTQAWFDKTSSSPLDSHLTFAFCATRGGGQTIVLSSFFCLGIDSFQKEQFRAVFFMNHREFVTLT